MSLLWPLLAVVVAIAVIALAATGLRGQVDVVVAKHPIRPFTEIEASDLETDSVAKEGFDGSATSIADVAGKLTTGAVAAGDRIEGSDVLALPDPAGKFRFQVESDASDALRLEPGEEVRLWLSPTDAAGRATVICARLLAVPDSGSAGDATYVVAVGAQQARVLAERLGRSRVLLTRPA